MSSYQQTHDEHARVPNYYSNNVVCNLKGTTAVSSSSDVQHPYQLGSYLGGSP